jgi:hypothetical protein
MKRFLILTSGPFVLIALLAGLTGCSSETPTPAVKKEDAKVPAAPPAPITGQSAVFSMYQAARQWSGDVSLLRVENIPLSDVKSEDGKDGAWRAVFVSLRLNQKRTYTFSVVDEGGTLLKGVRSEPEQPFASGPLVRPFAIQDLKVDSPAALAEAKKQKEVEAFLQKNPDTPVQFVAEWPSRTPGPSWLVIWGQSVGTSKFSVYVDAGSGKYLKKAQ